jgi:hypothetical protein
VHVEGADAGVSGLRAMLMLRQPKERKMRKGMGIAGVLALLLAGSVSAAEPGYVDAVDYPGNSEGWEAFYQLRRGLERDFDAICGDTFCEGEYSDYRPLRLRCSVNRFSGVMRQCTWTFAASEISVEPRTGRLLVDTRSWRCPIALPPGLTLPEFHRALAVERPLFEPLPGGQPIYESLIGCL